MGEIETVPHGGSSHAAARSLPPGRGHDWSWTHALEIGKPLPTLPLWLADNFALPLERESTYEETCRDLRIPLVFPDLNG
jgi:hypothetical protein